MSSPAPTLLATGRPPIAILGVPLDNLNIAGAIDLIERMIASRQPHYVVTANVDFLVQARTDVELRRILCDAPLVLCDGTPLLWVSRLLGNPLPERVAGADLVPKLIDLSAKKGYRLFFLGAAPQSAARAVARLRAHYPELIIAGHYSPAFKPLLQMDQDEIKRHVLEAKPDLLFVSFGCPKQEKWVAMHFRSLRVPVVIGVGATIDFLAGQVKRAPLWMQRIGAEWLFRLAQEPRRLFRRYFKDLWVFGLGVLAQWWRFRVQSSKFRVQSSKFRVQSSPCHHTSCVLLNLSGWLDAAAAQHGDSLIQQVLHEDQHCLLDTSGVQSIDSTGVGLLIRLQKQCRAAGRQLILLRPSPSVRRSLTLMRLNDFFLSAPDIAAAEQVIADRAQEPFDPIQPRPSGIPTVDPAVALAWRGEIVASNVELIWQQTVRSLEQFQDSLGPCNSRRDQAPTQTQPPHLGCYIDLSEVRFIDSSGLGLMVRAKKLARQRGLSLVFSSPCPSVRNVLQIAKLESYLLT
jgi:N-acetylglucosaminyldiphosphoundecaprenol N-acetyl-beta-D-mannosaminyltransferase